MEHMLLRYHHHSNRHLTGTGWIVFLLGFAAFMAARTIHKRKLIQDPKLSNAVQSVLMVIAAALIFGAEIFFSERNRY